MSTHDTKNANSNRYPYSGDTCGTKPDTYSITVKIVDIGTPYKALDEETGKFVTENGSLVDSITEGEKYQMNESRAGHMWYQLNKNGKETHCFGWASERGGVNVTKKDNDIYEPNPKHPVMTMTISISEQEYEALQKFPNLAETGQIPGFGKNGGVGKPYSVLTDSCIDFVALALNHVGLVDSDFEGEAGTFPYSSTNVSAFYEQIKKHLASDQWMNSSFIKKETTFPIYGEYEEGEITVDLYPPSGIIHEEAYEKDHEPPQDKCIPDEQKNSPSLDEAERNTSPLVIDLNGDGIKTTKLAADSHVYFDLDNNQFAEKTAWVDEHDGLLALDLNHNGKIDSGAELFGNSTKLADGTTAADGYQALAQYDDNGDGQIDSNDAVWNKLRIWQDADNDGITDSGELKTLAETGLSAISTTGKVVTETDTSGNKISHRGEATKVDGSKTGVADVWFKVDSARSYYQGGAIVANEALFIPNVA